MCVGYLVQNHEKAYLHFGWCVYPVHSAYSIDNIRILEYANWAESIRLVGEDKHSLGSEDHRRTGTLHHPGSRQRGAARVWIMLPLLLSPPLPPTSLCYIQLCKYFVSACQWPGPFLPMLLAIWTLKHFFSSFPIFFGWLLNTLELSVVRHLLST